MAAASSSLKNKNIITAFILGIIVTVFVSHAIVVYQTRALALQNRNDLNAITSFLQQATGGTGAVTPSETTESSE